MNNINQILRKVNKKRNKFTKRKRIRKGTINVGSRQITKQAYATVMDELQQMKWRGKGTAIAILQGMIFSQMILQYRNVWATQSTWATKWLKDSVARETVNRAFAKLVDRGYLIVQYGGFNEPNRYALAPCFYDPLFRSMTDRIFTLFKAISLWFLLSHSGTSFCAHNEYMVSNVTLYKERNLYISFPRVESCREECIRLGRDTAMELRDVRECTGTRVNGGSSYVSENVCSQCYDYSTQKRDKRQQVILSVTDTERRPMEVDIPSYTLWCERNKDKLEHCTDEQKQLIFKAEQQRKQHHSPSFRRSSEGERRNRTPQPRVAPQGDEKPHTDTFFAWCAEHAEKLKGCSHDEKRMLYDADQRKKLYEDDQRKKKYRPTTSKRLFQL